MHYRRRQKNLPQMTNMKISSTHSSRQQRNAFQQNRTKPSVPWETLVVREKRANVKTDTKCNRNKPTSRNALKLKKAQNELARIFLKESTEFIQNPINKIRIAWQTINEVSRRKSTAKAKLKATNQQE